MWMRVEDVKGVDYVETGSVVVGFDVGECIIGACLGRGIVCVRGGNAARVSRIPGRL